MPATQSARGAVCLLHVADGGSVWFGDGLRPALNTGLGIKDFLLSDYLTGTLESGTARLLGNRVNAPLVVALHQFHMRRRLGLQLGSPALVTTEGGRHRPDVVLRHLWQAPAGHWHDLGTGDFCSYALAQELEAGSVSEAARRIAAYHPAWPALSFLPRLDVDSACHLLAEILDPRWYRHPRRPHRHSRLYAYLGLTRRNIGAVFGFNPPDRHFERADLIVSTWWRGPRSGFLWRLVRRHADFVRGVLAACKKMISLACTVWSCTVAPPHPEVGFDPFAFFRDDVEARRFEHHRQGHNPV